MSPSDIVCDNTASMVYVRPSSSWLGPPNNAKLIPFVSSNLNHFNKSNYKDNEARVSDYPSQIL